MGQGGDRVATDQSRDNAIVRGSVGTLHKSGWLVFARAGPGGGGPAALRPWIATFSWIVTQSMAQFHCWQNVIESNII